MRLFYTLIYCLVAVTLCAQEVVYSDEFNNNILSVGNEPNGYTLNLVDEQFQIYGNGAAGPWTAFAYLMHNGENTPVLIDASEEPKLYIKARGENQPNLRIDFEDETGYVTNQNPVEVNLDNTYRVYELDFVGRLLDGAYGGPCQVAPCIVDASKLRALVFFVNAPNGGYSGTIDIEWISIGAPLEEIGGDDLHEIRYNQVSYLTGREKLISIVSKSPFENVEFSVFRDGESTPIRVDQVSSGFIWQASQEYVGTVDISAIDEIGNYRLETDQQTINFKISETGYSQLCEASLKYYYYNRASQELTSQYAGPWARPLGHPDDEVIVHASAASEDRPTGTIISSPKGWYDAGDYNKYVVNSGISTYTLLAAFEHYPEYYTSMKIDIPEQGGDLPDILDEVIWNLDWMLSMQDPGDGGVYHKLTGRNFSGIIMPHQYNLPRFVVQKTTAAALNLAAVAAVASRIFADYENVKPGYSEALLDAAINAYNWAKSNPTVYYNQPNDISTGQYGDGNVRDEFDWAAAELFITTGEVTYSSDINVNSIGNGVPAWPYTAPLALISLARHATEVEAELNTGIIVDKLLATANQLRSIVTQSSMRVAMFYNDDFVWGSNGNAGNQIVLLIRAYELTNDESYLDAAYLAMDYLLGRNGTGFCYVSGFGDKSPRRPHHRASEADNVSDPVPGMVAGGPNPGQQDGCPGYINGFPASSYVDSWCSYASNEVTINWNAPFAYAINALHFYQTKSTTAVFKDKPIDTDLTVIPNPGNDIIRIPMIEEWDAQRLDVFDMQGNNVLRLYNPTSTKVDVSFLNSGVYVVSLVGAVQVRSTKWVKVD
ncbi:MAG: glycoside hydrolase family 9 protein [Bacteroidota bacterium]